MAGSRLATEVRQFSIAHDAALAVLLAGAFVVVWEPRRHPGRWVRCAAWLLAGAIFIGWVGEYVADVAEGSWTVQFSLPLQLTDAVSLTAILALLSRRQLPIELLYFWAFSASLQAVLTPDLGVTFPDVLYFTYFLYHVGSILAALMLVFGCRRYPRPGAMWRVYALTLGWGGDCRRSRRDHRRQLHVPRLEAGAQLAAERDGAMARVHRRRRGRRARHVRRARRDRGRSCPARHAAPPSARFTSVNGRGPGSAGRRRPRHRRAVPRATTAARRRRARNVVCLS